MVRSDLVVRDRPGERRAKFLDFMRVAGLGGGMVRRGVGDGCLQRVALRKLRLKPAIALNKFVFSGHHDWRSRR